MPKEPQRNDKLPHLAGALFSSFTTHPLRVLMNRSAYHHQLVPLIKDLPAHFSSGISINLTRCFFAVSLQSYAMSKVKTNWGEDSAYGKLGGLFAAGVSGAGVATLIETRLIRKTLGLPGTRFSLPLTACYFLREINFSGVVLSAKDLPESMQFPALLIATTTSAACHKFAVWEASAQHLISPEMQSHLNSKQLLNGTIPSLTRDGFWKSARFIAKGDVYTHSSCKVPISDPKTAQQLLTNFFSIACGRTMFLSRLAYLMTFRLAYEKGVEIAKDKLTDDSEQQSLYKKRI